MNAHDATAGGRGISLRGERGCGEVAPEAGAHLPAALDPLPDRDQAAAWRARFLSSARVRLRHALPSSADGRAISVPSAARAAKCRRIAGLIVRFAPLAYRLERSPLRIVQRCAPGGPARSAPLVEHRPVRCYIGRNA